VLLARLLALGVEAPGRAAGPAASSASTHGVVHRIHGHTTHLHDTARHSTAQHGLVATLGFKPRCCWGLTP
jgi:hypothetical protein